MAVAPKTNRLGRSAALVQGLGLLAASFVAAAMYRLGMQNGEGYVIVGVNSAAAGVFFFWSLVLAVRAITAGERGNWPLAIILLVLIEIGLPCLGLWSEVLEDHHIRILNLMISLGLPVFGPFIAVGSLLAAPLALWRARKAEAAEGAAAVKTWRRKTWKVWLAWYAGVMFVLGIFVLPGPLFLLGASASQFYSYEEFDGEPEPVNWGQWIGKNMPDIVRDGVGMTLDHSQNSAYARAFQRRIEALGYASKGRLIAILSSDRIRGPFPDPAWQGLLKSYPDAVPETVDGIVEGHFEVANHCTRMDIATWVGRRGTISQMKLLLSGPQANKFKSVRGFFLSELSGNEHAREVLAELEGLAVANDLSEGELGVCFEIFANSLTPADRKRVWTMFLKAKDIRRTKAAAAAYLCVVNGDMEPMLLCLQHADLATRQAAAQQLALEGSALRPHLFRNPQNLEHRRLTERLFALLDDSDSTLRFSAMCVLGDIFREGVGDEARTRALQWLGGNANKTANAGEELGAVKAAVGKWLKENAPESSGGQPDGK